MSPRWRDRLTHDGRWAGLHLTVPGDGRGRVQVRAARPHDGRAGGFLRLDVGEQPRLWARIAADRAGFHWLRAPSLAPVVPPMDWPSLRAAGPTDDHRAWSRRFARALIADRTLDGGDWLIVPPGHPAGGPPVYALAAAVDLPRRAWMDWGINGAAEVLPLRDASPTNAGRVKAWLKWPGPLPPALLQWVSGLDCHVVLDGHDRLRAATLRGEAPQALTVVRRQHHPYDRAAWREAVAARIATASKHGARPATIAAMQPNLVAAWDPEHDWHHTSRAWPLAGGEAEWRASLPADAAPFPE